MTLKLQFQSPDAPSVTVLELLAESADIATEGGGVFSFASTQGVDLLFADPVIEPFLRRSAFHLVVGVDAITTPAVLLRLASLLGDYPALRVDVFYHARPGVLFHPKLCWFGSARTGRVLVGSANLTRGGLLKNWEAVADVSLSHTELVALKRGWAQWLGRHRELLRDPSDAEVIARAQVNAVERVYRRAEVEVETEEESPVVSPDASVLIAEIPRASTRWNQANFNLETFRGFFGLEPGTFRRVVLFPVAVDGTVGRPEVRQSVSVKSRNYRIELGLASGLRYPEHGRPIAVFLKIGPRRFRYRLTLPTDPGYPELRRLLDAVVGSQSERMRRVVTDVTTLEQYSRGFQI